MSGNSVLPEVGVTEALAPAKSIAGSNGIRIAKGTRSVEYIALLFDEHQILDANGLEVESFLPRPYAMPFLLLQILP